MARSAFLLAVPLVLCAHAARAQEGPPPGGPGPGGPEGGRPRPPLVLALDANQDGTIDKQEIGDATAALKRLDKDRDGRLTPEETRPSRGGGPGMGGPGGGGPGGSGPRGQGPGGGGPGGGPPPDGPPPGGGGPGGGGPRGGRPRPPLDSALDADQDGVIDTREMANASAALKTLDKNQDGSLTLEEIRPFRPRGERPPDGSGEGRPPRE
jgi:hypothetical protein